MNLIDFPTVEMPYFELAKLEPALASLLDNTKAGSQRKVPASSPAVETIDQMRESTKPRGELQERREQGQSRLDSAVAGLATTILNRFPLAAPTLLLFVGSERNPHIDSTCSLVAESLARRKIGNVLLVDSNESGRLTRDGGLASQPGLCEIVNQQFDWKTLVTGQSTSNLDFLPCGIGTWEHWGGLTQLRESAAEMKHHYQFICVSAGDAHEKSAQAWSSICDGSYLLVSLKNSNGTIAQSAVAELQSSGARLLGCVVTDSD